MSSIPADPSPSEPTPLRRVRIRVRRPVPWYRRLLRRRVLLLAAVPAVLLIAAAIELGVAYAPAVQALLDGRDAAQSAAALLRTAAARPDTATLDRATALLQEAQDDLGERSQVLDSGLIGGVVAHLPWAGEQMQAVRQLRHAGQAAVATGLDLLPVARRLLDPGPGSTALAALTAAVEQQRPQLARLGADLDRLDAAVAAVPGGSLVGPLGAARDTLRTESASLDSGLRPALALAGALPSAIGDGTHTYLLLLTNPGEERPGGGFIGAVGEVTFSNGSLARADFRPSDFANPLVHSLPAPRALDQYMFHGTPWQLSDAGWSPDFPTTAAAVLDFWKQATGSRPDGVIEVDPLALGDVLKVLGPVSAAGRQVSGDQTLLQLNRIVNEPGQPGKPFLAPFGAAMVREVTGAHAAQLPALAGVLHDAILGKHLVLHFDDATLQSLVDRGNAGGSLQPPPSGDSLLVADANLSAGKEDLFVQRAAELSASVGADGTVRDHLVLTYVDAPPSDPVDAPLVEAGGGAYRDYVRVYVPAGAVVDGLSESLNGGAPVPLTPDAVGSEGGREAVGVFVIVPRGATLSVTLDEHSRLASAGYRLAWTKQLNALPMPIGVTVSLPGAAPQHRDGVLDTDRSWSFPG